MTAKKLCFVMTVFLLLQVMIYPSQAANTETIRGGYTVGDKTYDLIKGVFKFPSEPKINGSKIDISARFFYSDGFFAEDPYKYNAHLASASMCMAMAGFNSNEGGTDYSNKGNNIVQYMKDIGVDGLKIDSIYNRTRPSADSIGVTIGSRVQAQNNNRTLIIISIRGGNYGREWVSNVTIGGAGEAEGIAKAADNVINFVKRYLSSNNLLNAINSGNVDFWVAGYSRGGGAANIAAKRLIESYSGNGNKIFAYCIEAMKSGVPEEEKQGFNYMCIHNVINLNDFAPYAAPNVPNYMNFKRYGIDHYIPGSDAGDFEGKNYDNTYYTTSSDQYINVKQKMLSQLKAVNPHVNFLDTFAIYGFGPGFSTFNTSEFIKQGSPEYMNIYLNNLITYLFEWTKTDRARYFNYYQEPVRDLLSLIYNATSSQTKLFRERLKKLWDQSGDVCELLVIFFYSLGNWNSPDFEYKEQSVNKIISLLDKYKCLEALELSPAAEQNIKEVILPRLLDAIMMFASTDFNKELYDTKGLTQILSFLFNSDNILINHYPEVEFSWLRAQDSLYDNETSSVSYSYSDYDIKASSDFHEIKASSAGKIAVIGEVPDVFVEHGADYKSELPGKVNAVDSQGNITELAITWDYDKAKWYAPNYDMNGDLWVKAENIAGESNNPAPLMGILTGKVSGAELSGDVSSEVIARVFIAGISRLAPPDSSLPDGEYEGPQTVILSLSGNNDGSIMYSLIEAKENEEVSEILPVKYTGPVTIGEEGLTESRYYYLIANTASNVDDAASSDVLIWYYKINPANSEDESSEYVNNTVSSVITLSKDYAVCWSIDKDNITFSDSESNSGITGSIFAAVTPWNANEVPVKEIHVTFAAVKDFTRRGVYTIPVKISTDGGSTWTAEKALTFSAGKNSGNTQQNNLNSGSSGGCDLGLSALGLCFALTALVIGRKS